MPRRALLAGALLLASAASDTHRAQEDAGMSRKPRIEGRFADRRERPERETASIEGFESVFGIRDEAVRRIVTETYPRGWAAASNVGAIRADASDLFVITLFREENGPATISIFPDAEEFGLDVIIGRGLIDANEWKTSESGASDRSELLEIALNTPAGTEEEWEALVSAKLSELNPNVKDEEGIKRAVSAAREALAISDPDFLPWSAARDRTELLAGEYRRMNRERIGASIRGIPSGALRIIVQRRLDERPSDLEEKAEGLLKGLEDRGIETLAPDIVEEMRKIDAEMRTRFAADCAKLTMNGGSAVTAYHALLEKISAYESPRLDGEPELMRSRADGVIRAIGEFSAMFEALSEGEKGRAERTCAGSTSRREALIEMSGRVRGGLHRVVAECEAAANRAL